MQRNYDTMSNMKDYMMWIDDRGVATWDNSIGELIIPEGVNIYTPELISEYHADKDWHGIDDEDDFIIDDDEDNVVIDTGDDFAWSPTEDWIDSDGAMTSTAIAFLNDLDSEGELV